MFKYVLTDNMSYKIEYLQDAVYQTKKPLKNPVRIVVILEEIGGWLILIYSGVYNSYYFKNVSLYSVKRKLRG